MPSTVFKKQSPNSRLTVYLSSREFVQEDKGVTAIDGVVQVDPMYLKDRKVFAMVVLTFRYGREDEEVMGLKFFTEAVLDFKQIFPVEETETHDEEEEETLTPLQQNLMRKLGSDALPLNLKVSTNAPPSVRLQPARVYSGSPLGVQYDLKIFIADNAEERHHKRSTIKMGLRCVRYAPLDNQFPALPPCATVNKTFVFSPGRLELQTVLNREIFLHGDSIRVHVTVNNNSNKTVHKIKLYVLQHVNVCMFTNGRFKNIVGCASTDDGHPIPPGASFSRDFCIKPMSFLKYPVALAVDTGFHDECNFLASSTLSHCIKEDNKNPYGVIVKYEVKVKTTLSCLDRPITMRLPFKLMHPRPPEGAVELQRSYRESKGSEVLEEDDVTAHLLTIHAS